MPIHTYSEEQRRALYEQFRRAVNLEPKEIEAWLETEESRSVGRTKRGGHSEGHRLGKQIAHLKRRTRDQLDDDDYDLICKALSYIPKHAQKQPDGEDLEGSKWRYALMNWGHDPLRH